MSFFRLSVCLLFVRHAVERKSLCARFRHDDEGVGEQTILILLDRGRFVVVHPCSTFSDCRQLVTPQDAEVQKAAQKTTSAHLPGQSREWVTQSDP